MNSRIAKRQKVGQRVRHLDDNTEGEIIETGYNAIKVRWDDGVIAIYKHVSAGVTRVEPIA